MLLVRRGGRSPEGTDRPRTPHAAWSPWGLKGDFLISPFGSREAEKIFWLFDRALRGQTATRFRDSSWDGWMRPLRVANIAPTAPEETTWPQSL